MSSPDDTTMKTPYIPEPDWQPVTQFKHGGMIVKIDQLGNSYRVFIRTTDELEVFAHATGSRSHQCVVFVTGDSNVISQNNES